MYSGVPFRMLPLDEVEEYLRDIKSLYSVYADMIERIYLVGADPFVLSAVRLEERADLIRRYLPAVKVITMYARISNVMNKSDDDLRRLKTAGINDLYVGTECGLDYVLSYLNKGNSAADTRVQCMRLNDPLGGFYAGINHRDLLMLGTAGRVEVRRLLLLQPDSRTKLSPICFW